MNVTAAAQKIMFSQTKQKKKKNHGSGTGCVLPILRGKVIFQQSDC